MLQRKSRKILSLIVLSFVILLQGCSINSLLIKASNARPIVIIEHPPNRIGYVGDLDKDDMKNMRQILKMMQSQKYKNHQYKFRLGADINFDSYVIEKDSFEGSSSTATKRSEGESTSNSGTNPSTNSGGV